MKGPGICIKATNLLLARTFNFLEIMKVLFNAKTVCHGLKNLLSSGRKIGAHEGSPSVVSFPSDQHKDLATGGPIGSPEEFNVFGFLTPVKRRLYRKPPPIIRRLMTKINSLAVLARSSPFAFFDRHERRAQSGIFSQSGNKRGSSFNRRFKKSGFGIATVGNHPKLFSKAFAAVRGPFDKFGCLLKFGLKPYPLPIYISGSDIHSRQDRQADGPPIFVTNQSREDDPDVAVDELGPIGGNGGIAMDARPLDLRAVSPGGGIINSHKYPVLLLENAANHHFKQHRGDGFSFSSHRADKVIESFILPDNAGGSEPTGNRFSRMSRLSLRID